MHRHHAFGRQVIVQRREHRLLHLAGIEAAADQDHAPGEIDRDHGLRAHAVLLRIGLEGRQAENGEVRRVAGKLLAIRADQQRADEQRVPCEFGEHARLDAVFRIGAAIKVLREKLLALGVREEVIEQDIELHRRELAVLLPPDRLLGAGVADNELVFRRTAGVHAGLGAERAAFDHVAFLGVERVFVKLLGGEVPMHPRQILQAEFVGAVGAIPKTRLVHADLRTLGFGEAGFPAARRRRRGLRPLAAVAGAGLIVAILRSAKRGAAFRFRPPREC